VQQRTTVLSIALLLGFFAIGTVIAGRLLVGAYVPLVSDKRIAILPITGVIDSERQLLRQLERYREDRSVRGFVVEIRSPGGVVGSTQSIYLELQKLRDEDERPVIAWIGDVGASGGYYVALASDSILALPGAITGSIGVIMEFPNAQELLRKVGVDMEVVKSGEYKDLGSPVRELRDEERVILQEVVDDVYWQFVRAVEENRRLTREEVVALADGRIFTGEQGVELGLVDRVATLAEAISVAGRMAGIGERPETIRPLERRVGLFDLLRGVEESRLLSWLEFFTNRAGGTPRLRYQWR
jgi:protease-4